MWKLNAQYFSNLLVYFLKPCGNKIIIELIDNYPSLITRLRQVTPYLRLKIGKIEVKILRTTKHVELELYKSFIFYFASCMVPAVPTEEVEAVVEEAIGVWL